MATSSWRERIKEPQQDINLEKKMEQEPEPTESDIIWKHPDTEANIRLHDSGAIGIFADHDTGMLIDPEAGAITTFADKANMYHSSLHFHTNDDGLKWNFVPFNPDMQDPLREVLSVRRYTSELLPEVLNSSGMYMAPEGPVSPAGAAGLVPTMDIQGQRVYSNKLPQEAEKLMGITKSTTEMISDLIPDSVTSLNF